MTEQPVGQGVDPDFDAILNETAQEFASAEIINTWMPPDGDYTVLLLGYKEGKKLDPDNRFIWWRIDGMILAEGNPSIDKHEFTVGYYTSKAIFSLKRDTAVLNGSPLTALSSAGPILAGAVGWIVNVSVRTAKAKNGNIYTNTSITEVVSTSETEASPETEAPEYVPEVATQ